MPSCIEMMDGALITLIMKPNVWGEDYFSRKMNYALSTLLVTDHESKFLYVHASYVGSTHHNRVFSNSRLWLQPDMFFEGEEYIIADLANIVFDILIPAYNHQNLIHWRIHYSIGT